MKHFKLFMMLALLVMGVSNVSAEKVWVDTQKTTWYDTELGLEFSTKYNRTGSSTEAAPNGGVAVRLYLGQTKQVTDTVSYEASWGGSVYNGANAQLTTTTNRTTNNVSDDDNDGAGTRANYKCLGRLDYHGYGAVNVTVTTDPEYTYFYERTHTIKYSERTSVVIPATAEDPDGNEHDVTAIQKWGMCYAKTAQNDLDYCSTNNVSAGGEPTHSTPVIVHNNINSHRNEYLAEVTFAEDCNIASIGDYAFMSCDALSEIQIPWTVSYLGQGTFECCMNLIDVELQECPDHNSTEFGTTRIRTIEDFTFWFCRRLENVYLADGITRIEGKSYGSPFQYMDALSYVRLPNTLLYIGPHFLCSCTGIQKLTIPASVTYIDGACFHGCESLEEVYVLGEPADLQGLDGNSKTFDANKTNCGSHVNNAKFYVASTQLNAYKSHNVWKELDANNNNYGNELLPIPEIPTIFTAGKWSTVIFPKRISNTTNYIATTQAQINDLFGEGAKIARLSEVRLNGGTFHLKFTQISEIPCGVPLMIKPAVSTDEDGNTINEYTYEMYGADDEADRNFRIDMTDDHDLSIKCSNSEDVVTMKGQYMKVDPLKKYDFIFKAEQQADNTYKYTFRKFVNGNAYVNPFRCWWRVTLNGYSMTSPSSQQSKFATFDDFDTTGINSAVAEPKIVIDGVYDLQGRRIDVDEKQLPSGMYIVNGKKVIKK